jgi:hypothetical protein
MMMNKTFLTWFALAAAASYATSGVMGTLDQLRLRSRDLAKAEAKIDCDSGCPLKKKKVCGTDGFTYQNECLCICQGGVTVAKQGNCPGDNTFNENKALYDEDGKVDKATMDRFQDEKFKLVGKRKLLAYDVLDDADETELEDTESQPLPPWSNKVKMSRLSHDLYEYMAEVDMEEIPEDMVDSPPQHSDKVSDGDDGIRKLLVFEPDTRICYTETPPWPTRLNGRTDIGCSGTIISPDCNWRDIDFTPAQYKDSSGTVIQPYGSWTMQYVTTYTIWRLLQFRPYDIAVARYFPNSAGENFGTLIGWAGLKQTRSDSPGLDKCYNAGYPDDKAYPNNELWESYCGAVFHHSIFPAIEVPLANHWCDTYSGSSGSSFMDHEGYIHAIHVAHHLDGTANIALLINPVHYSNVLRWAYWGSQQIVSKVEIGLF